MGSSPLTRGILIPLYLLSYTIYYSLSYYHITYTQVHPRSRGEYKKTGNNNLSKQVHPRSRGEYIFDAGFGTFDLGSSPLTRGIRMRCLPAVPRHRFTPAHAGNTGLASGRFLCPRVHPRSRGEYVSAIVDTFAIPGSPPLTRGILTGNTNKNDPGRFTPAHAGNTNFFIM